MRSPGPQDLFEGEGSIHVRPNGSLLATELTTTDLDVIEHFAAVITDALTPLYFAPPKSRGCGKPHWKERWTWRAQAKEAVQVIDLLLPFFGARRSARAIDAKERYLEWVDEKTAVRTCEYCSQPFRPKLRGHGRQIYCDHVCCLAAQERKRLERVAAALIVGQGGR